MKKTHFLLAITLPLLLILSGCEATNPTQEATATPPAAAPVAAAPAPSLPEAGPLVNLESKAVAEVKPEHCEKHAHAQHDGNKHCSKHKGKKSNTCVKHCEHKAAKNHDCAKHCADHKGKMDAVCDQHCAKEKAATPAAGGDLH